MKISIIGTGYVGLVNGACLADMGNDVTCIDIDKEKIDNLNNGVIPIYEPGLEELIQRNIKSNRIHFSTDYSSIKSSNVTYITVGTPPKEDGSADLKYVLSAAECFANEILKVEKENNVFPTIFFENNMLSRYIIVTKSTVPVGTSKKVYDKIYEVLEENNRTDLMNFIGVVSNPEFLKEGTAINDCMYPDRIVVGVNNGHDKCIMENLYTPFIKKGNKILFTNVPSSEMIKYASNSMLATRISFMNEIANLCEVVGANVDDVRKGMGADKRIGDKFLYPGCGYGGSCFPKDVRALVKTAEDNGLEMKIIKATEEVNNSQKHILYKKLSNIKDFSLEGKTIAVLGLAFKPKTDDMREAPSLVFMNDLIDNVKDVKIRAYDPISMNVCKRMINNECIYYAIDMYDAIKGADALVLVTEWDEFRSPDWNKIIVEMNNNIVVDGRNVLKETIPNTLNIRYYSIG
jgi:UDPglucose 6-dehydrogenase